MIKPLPWTQRKFEQRVELDSWPGLVQRIRGTPARAAALAADAADAELSRRPSPDAWSAKEHIGHLADLHPLDDKRLAEYLAGAGELSAADPSNAATYAANHNATPIERILDQLAEGRAALAERLEALSESDLQRVAIHPRLRQPMRLIDWCHFVAEHDDHHLAAAFAALRSATGGHSSVRANEVNEHRALFDLPADVAYLNCANLAPQLRAITAAGAHAARTKASPWTVTTSDWFDGAEELRGLAAGIIGVDADGVALIPSVSYGMAIAAKNARVEAGQSIVMPERDFPSNVYAWRALAGARGARVVMVAREQSESWADALERAIDDTTAVVSVPPCHWMDGGLVDLERVATRARAVGAMLVVDASQSLGAMPIDVARVQPDFLMAVGYKWMLGPYGLGYLYAAPAWRANGAPIEESWLVRRGSEDFTRLTEYVDDYRDGARRFDMGEFPQFIHTPMAIAALRQLSSWTVPFIYRELSRLNEHAAQLATEMGWRVEPATRRAGHLLGIRFPDGVPDSVSRALADAKVYVSIRGDVIRIAPHLYNSRSDIDRLFGVLASSMHGGR
jgi:selenocysteine lyase/cysteine desulfurase